MKFIFEIILTTVIIFFLWNILKRLFFSSFYKFIKPPNGASGPKENSKKSVDSKINWDAETVDYEEIKEDKEYKK
jgi:hypothetical protein